MLQVDRQRSRGRRAWPRRNAHLRHRHRKKDANSRAGGVGKGAPQFRRFTLDHQSHAESQGNRTGHAFATSMRAQPNRG